MVVTLPLRSDASEMTKLEVPAGLLMVPSKSRVAKVCVAWRSSVAPESMIRSVALFKLPVSLMVPALMVVSPV